MESRILGEPRVLELADRARAALVVGQQQVLLAAVNHQDVGKRRFRVELQVGNRTAAGEFDSMKCAVGLHHADRLVPYHRDLRVGIELARRPEGLLRPRIEQIEACLVLVVRVIDAPSQQFPPEFGETNVVKRLKCARLPRPRYGPFWWSVIDVGHPRLPNNAPSSARNTRASLPADYYENVLLVAELDTLHLEYPAAPTTSRR